MHSWDSRFGLQGVEPLGFDLTDPTGAGLLPGVGDLEGALEQALSGQALSFPFGSSTAEVRSERIRVPFRLDLGVFDWLTVGVTVPLEKSRTQVTHLLAADSSQLGPSPALSNPASVSAFLDEIERALTDVRSAGNLAQLEQDLQSFRDGLTRAYETSALFPSQQTAGGHVLEDYLEGLNASLGEAGIGPVAAVVPLAAFPIVNADGLDNLLVGDGFLYRQGLESYEGLWQLGDMELHAALRLLEGAVRDSAGAPVRLRWLLGVEGRLRLPTGTTDDPDLLLDVGSGDGQTDVEGGAFAHLSWGRWAASVEGRLGRQRSTILPRRVAPPHEVLVPLSSRRSVEWTPGGYVLLSVAPRFHLTPELALMGVYRYASTSAAEYREVGNVPADDAGFQGYLGPSWGADVLGLESERTVHEIGAGLAYSTLEAWGDGRTSSPVELSFSVRSAVSGAGGLTPKGLTLRLGIRLYRRLWGG